MSLSMAFRISHKVLSQKNLFSVHKQSYSKQLRKCWFLRESQGSEILLSCSHSFSSNSPHSHEILLQRKSDHVDVSSEEVSENFKMAMRKVPQQVAVVTSSFYDSKASDWIKRGVTCSTFSSVSVNPPIVSFCLIQGSRMHDIIKARRKFAVHILSQDQIHEGIHFSVPAKEDICQFKNIPHVQGEETLPILLGSLAVLLCNAHSYHGVGDHTVWYGNVDGVSVSETLQEPLIYFTRKFRSVGDEIFLKAFEETTLPFERWSHEAHLRMAWNYIKDHGKQGAIPFIKLGIQKFNERNKDKIKTGYHESITMFFIHLVSDAVVQSVKANETFEEFLAENEHLINQDLLLEYYSKEILFSKEARYQFILPDKKSLP